MNLTIYTYGYFDALYYVLNGLAMFRNSGFYMLLIQSIMVMVATYYAIRMSYTATHSNWRQYLLKTFGMLVVINSLLIPKAEMILKDNVTKTIGKIDNIPVAFALPVGILEEFGHIITIGFEQVFAPIEEAVNPNNPVFSYYNYGMLFGARLRHEVSNLQIKSPEFAGNMHSFIRQCVVLPSMIGHQFNKEELMASNNMWKLVSEKAGTLTRVDLSIAGKKTSMTCKEAATHFENYWNEEYVRVISKYRDTDYGRAKAGANYTAPSMSLSNVFENNVKVLYGGSEPAGNILRQQMMINSMSDYKSGNYGTARARMQQESSSLISSDLASLYLPMMLVIFKCIIYSAFIFLVPLLLFSGGMSKYTSYLTLIASLQLWPSINAIINMIVGTYSNLKLGSPMLVSYSTASTVNNSIDTIVSVAGGLQIITPFLAYWMTNLGASGLMSLAGNMISGAQSSASAIGGEVASGNRNIDNINEGNLSINMRGANKTDYNMQYFDGANTTQLEDGTIQKANADGSMVFNSGQGITASSGSARFNIESGMQNQISQGIQQTESMLNSDQRSYSESKGNTFSNTADYVAHLAQREHAGESFNYDSLGEQGKSLRHAVNQTKLLSERNNYGWRQNTQASLEAHAKGSLPFMGITGTDIGAGVSGSIGAENSSDQSFGSDNTINRENHTDSSYNNVVRAASNSSWAKENNIDKSYSDAVRGSYEEQKRLEGQISARQEQLDNWHQAKTRLDTKGASYNKDMYHKVEQELQNMLGVTSKEAHRMIERGDPMVIRGWGNIISREMGGIMPEIRDGKNRVSGTQSAQQLDNFTNEYSSNIVQDVSQDVKKVALDNKLNPDRIEKEIVNSRGQLQRKNKEIIKENATQYSAVKNYNEMEESITQQAVDKYEEDRIGQGVISKNVMESIDWVTQGKIGNRIGGPDKNFQKDFETSNSKKEKDIKIDPYSKVTNNKERNK